MLPILAGLVVGSGAGPRRGLLLAGSYVLSMALVYAGLGVVAALLGGNLQAWLQQPWLLGSFAALFVFLALPMFGFFELQLPAACATASTVSVAAARAAAWPARPRSAHCPGCWWGRA